jgi:hypothetical protein
VVAQPLRARSGHAGREGRETKLCGPCATDVVERCAGWVEEGGGCVVEGHEVVRAWQRGMTVVVWALRVLRIAFGEENLAVTFSSYME